MVIRLVTLLLLTAVVIAQNYRLPENIVLKEYDLTVKDVTEKSFSSGLTVSFDVKEDTNTIVLHTGFSITQTKYTVINTKNTADTNPATGKVLKDSTDQYEIKLDDATKRLAKGNTYKIDFESIKIDLDTKPDGFYAADSGILWLTQFQAIGARRALPCWDEPGMKATFKLTVNHPDSYTVLSSVKETPQPAPPPVAKTSSAFAISPLMSPHTMSWAVMKNVEKNPSTDARITMYTRKEISKDHTSTALEAAAAAVKQFEMDFNSATETTRKLDKLDMIATYNTKFPGANNWGLQVYRETDVLFMKDDSSTTNLQRVWQLVTHEVTHQWFGDVATFKWWNETWLSEGFATYYEYFTPLDKWSKWQMAEQFVVQQTQVALQADCHNGVSSPPLIRTEVNSNKEIEKVFDVISSSKGASIIRMLNLMMGDDKFKAGIRKYLVEGKNKNVGTNDLWDALTLEMPPNVLPSGVKLNDVMDKWSTIPGFPEIKVTRNYINATTIEQSQFLLTPSNKNSPLWYVPFYLTTETSQTTSTPNWLSQEKSKTLAGPVVTKDQWILLNKDGGVFYRVNYDERNWKLLSEALLKLTTSSRAILMDDALNLARGGRLDYSIALNVTKLLPNETSFVPWSAALNGLSYLYDRLSNETESRKVVEKYIRDKMNFVYTHVKGFTVGTDDPPHEYALTRQLILHWACRVNHEGCVKEANQQFETWRIKPPIKQDVRRVSYCTGMKTGGATEFKLLEERYATSSMPDKPRIIHAMGCANETDLLTKYLGYSIKPGIPGSSFIGREIFSAVCRNPDGVDLAFFFLTSNWRDAGDKWKGGLTEVGKAFSEDLAPKLNTKEQLEQLERLMIFSTLGDAEEGVKIAIRTLNETLVWQENYRKTVFNLMGGVTPKPNIPKKPGTSSTVYSTSISSFTLLLTVSLSLLAAIYRL